MFYLFTEVCQWLILRTWMQVVELHWESKLYLMFKHTLHPELKQDVEQKAHSAALFIESMAQSFSFSPFDVTDL